MAKLKPIVYGVGALAAGAFCVHAGVLARGKQALLDKEGIEVSGNIISGKSRDGRRVKSHNLDVVWTPEGGRFINQDFTVSKEFFSSVTDGGFITKPDVTVRYAPSDPKGTAILLGGTSHSTQMFPVGFGILAVGAGLVTYGVKKPA